MATQAVRQGDDQLGSRCDGEAKAEAVSGGAMLAFALLYGGAFTALHHYAATWAGTVLFSLWYPAAGVRFALLWRLGPRFGLVAAAADLLANAALGAFDGRPPNLALIFAGSIVGAPLAYSIVVALVQRRARRFDTRLASIPPLPMAIAAILGPIAASMTSSLWWIVYESAQGTLPAGFGVVKRYGAAIVTFLLGDTLGLMLIAPPLLLLLSPTPSKYLVAPRTLPWMEWMLVMAAGWAAVWLVSLATPSVRFDPLLIAVAWMAMRAGRWASWAAVTMNAAIILTLSGAGTTPEARVELHLLLAVMAIVAILLGSLSDAQQQLRRDLARRDRTLYHAERLKTLRAMSLAVIHEISQPLSTLAIEAKQVRRLAETPRPDNAELLEASAAVERQSERLSTIVTRLRSFGSRSGSRRELVQLSPLLNDVAALATPEARKLGLRIEVLAQSGLTVFGHAVELQQAVLNLVRNAIAASGSGPAPIRLIAEAVGGDLALIAVEDEATTRAARERAEGMGLGLAIVRAIVEAHGGNLSRRPIEPRGSRYEIQLPVMETHE